MITVKFDDKKFMHDMNNIMNYSIGFVDGSKKGMPALLTNMGVSVKEILGNYIDSLARVNPQSLHHVYEWYQTGIENSRLFNIDYTVTNVGLSFGYTFTQSMSIKSGSRVPFYNKARIMEDGAPVIIRPRNSDVLVFEDGDQTVFTKNPVKVKNPGGQSAGEFSKTFNSFFQSYFSQSFFRVTGLDNELQNPVIFKQQLNAGKRSGRNAGIAAGYKWIANAGVTK